MEILAIIPARGGSKGIPRKNLRVIAGRPLLAHTIEEALASPSISRVVVSTDDAEIARLAESSGAEVVARPPEISGDTASSEPSLLHVLDWMRDREQYEPDLIAFLQATSPLRRVPDIEGAIATFLAEKADSLFSANRVEGFVWRCERDGGGPRSLSYDYRCRPRRQDAPEDLIENGAIYLFRPSLLRSLGNRLGGRISVYRMAAVNSIQIDTVEDLELVERLLTLRRENERQVPNGFPMVRLVVIDFDGVLTDNRVLVDQHGTEAVFCSRSDGWGIARLREAGVRVVVLSTERNSVVEARCRKLQIETTHGVDDKLAHLERLLDESGVNAEQVAFVGNDVNDLECLARVGVSVAVADAEPEVLRACRYVTSRRGGHGAIREVAEWILDARRQGRPAVAHARASDSSSDRG